MKQCRYFKAYQGIYEPRCGCDACWIKYVETRVAMLKAKNEIAANEIYEACVEMRERQEAEATMYKYPPCKLSVHFYVISEFGEEFLGRGIPKEEAELA